MPQSSICDGLFFAESVTLKPSFWDHAIQGQQIYGTWTSLAETNLNEGRDLVVTTDFRDVLSSILGQQWGLNTRQLAQVFPTYQAGAVLPFFG